MHISKYKYDNSTFYNFYIHKKKKKNKNLAELSKNKSCTLQLIQLPCAGPPEIYNFKPFLHSNSGHGHTSKAHLFSITNKLKNNFHKIYPCYFIHIRHKTMFKTIIKYFLY